MLSFGLGKAMAMAMEMRTAEMREMKCILTVLGESLDIGKVRARITLIVSVAQACWCWW